MTDLRQTEEYAKYLQFLGWEVSRLSGVYCYARRIPLLGYFVKLQRPDRLIPLTDIEKLRERKKIYSISIEPLDNQQLEYYSRSQENLAPQCGDELSSDMSSSLSAQAGFRGIRALLERGGCHKKRGGFKLSKTTSLPSKTIQIDLNQNSDKILKRMHYKTRYNIGLSPKRGVFVKPSKDIDLFIDFWHKSAKRRGFYLPLKKEIESLYKAFGNKAHLLFANYENELISAVLLVDSKDTTHYMYAASTLLGNKHFAPSLLVWESIKLAKKLKRKTFDFEGIYDDRFPLKSWKGFTRFKEGFGGQEVVFPGALQRTYFPFSLKLG